MLAYVDWFLFQLDDCSGRFALREDCDRACACSGRQRLMQFGASPEQAEQAAEACPLICQSAGPHAEFVLSDIVVVRHGSKFSQKTRKGATGIG